MYSRKGNSKSIRSRSWLCDLFYIGRKRRVFFSDLYIYIDQVASYESGLCDNMDGPFPPLCRAGLFNAT